MLPSHDIQRRPRLRDQVYEALRAMIRAGAFPPEGAVESQLAAHLNVSRTPVREALFQLCREFMLEDTGRGYRVPGLSEADMREIIELRMMIEPPATALAIARTGQAALPALRGALDAEEMAHRDGDLDGFAAANSRFRARILESCANARVSQTLALMDDQVQRLRLRTLGIADNRALTLRGHAAIIDAFDREDPDSGAQAMRDILEAAGRFYAGLSR